MTDLDALLRTLDPAPAGPLGQAERARAARTLEQIVATTANPVPAPQAGPGVQARVVRPPRRRRLVTRVALVAAAAVAVPLVLDGVGGETAAYASWTATPQAVAQRDLNAAARACRDKLRGGSLDLARARLVLSERRGEFVAVLYRTDVPDVSGACLVHEPAGSAKAGAVDAGVGGSSGPALPAPPGGFTEGAIFSARGASITDGAVGAGVTGVTIHAGVQTVHATVDAGRYVAWWPGPAFATGADGKPHVRLTYDVTLADGTVLRDAPPARPQ